MLLDLVVFCLAAWILGNVVRLAAFKGRAAPIWLSGLSGVAIGALAFAAIWWGQVESFQLYMESLFGPTYSGRPFQPQPPIFTSIAVASVWIASLQAQLRFPRFRTNANSSSAGVSDAQAAPKSEPRKWGVALAAAAILGLTAIIGAVVLFNPSNGFLAQSREQCLAQRMERASNEVEFVAAQQACDQRPTEVELRCRLPFRGDTSAIDARLYTHRYGRWEVQMHNPYSAHTFGRFTVRIRFRDNSVRNYDVALSEPLQPRQVVSGYFEPMGADRQKVVGTWDFVGLTTCP